MPRKSQAAAIPFRRSQFGAIEVLLVSLSGGGWGLPKGGIKKGHSAQYTAARETLEEVGVQGRLVAPAVGQVSYRKRGRRHVVTVFGLEVHRMHPSWDEDDRRLRIWVSLGEASRLVTRRPFARLLARLQPQALGARPTPLRAAA